MRPKPTRRAPARPTASRANSRFGLIATGKSVRQSVGPQAALDNRSHRTPIVHLQSACYAGAVELNLECGCRAHNLMPSALAGATNVRLQVAMVGVLFAISVWGARPRHEHAEFGPLRAALAWPPVRPE